MPTPAEQAAEEALIKHALARGYLSPAALDHARAQRMAAPGTPLLAVLAGVLPPAALPELRAIYNQQLSGPSAGPPPPSPPPQSAGAPPPSEAATQTLASVADAPSASGFGVGALAGAAVGSGLIFGLLGAIMTLAMSAEGEAPKPAPGPPTTTTVDRSAVIKTLSSKESGPLPDPRDVWVALGGAIDVELLRELAASERPRVRHTAAALLGLLRDSESEPLLATLAKDDEDPLMALLAADALGRLKSRRPVPKLLLALKAERMDMRLYAIDALADCGGREALAALLPLAKADDDPDVRAAAVRAALAISPTSLERLRPDAVVVTRDPDPDGTFVARGPDLPDELGRSGPGPKPTDPVAPTPKPPPKPAPKPADPVTPKPVAKKPPPPPKANAAAKAVSALVAGEQFQAALDRATKALTLFPDHAELTRLSGRAHLGLGDLEEAEAALKKAIDLAPDVATSYFDLSAMFATKKQKKNAHGALGMALRLGFRDVEALRSDPHFAKVKGTKPFRSLMGRFFNSTEVAEADPAKRLKFSSKQLKAVFKRELDPHLRALEVVRFPEAGSVEATRFLCGLLRDKASVVRMAVAEVLGKTTDPAAMKYLCDQAASKMPPKGKVAVLRALATLKTPDAFLPLLSALEDKSLAVRVEAARALGNHPDKRAIDPLIALLATVKPKDAVVINEALGKITGEDLGIVADDWRNWWSAHPDAKIGPIRNPCGELKRDMTVATPSGFSDRSGKSKKRALRKNGGTKSTESAVQAALAWLARHQSEGGNWDTDSWAMECKEKQAWERVTKVRKRRFDVRNTGLALMAFLGAGHTHVSGKYSRKVRRGLEFLKGAQRADGYFVGDHHDHVGYSHAAATIAMCEAYLMTRDCHYKAAAEDAIGWIVRRQHQNGGWGWTKEESYTSLTTWNLVALNTAYQAGLDVPASAIVSVRYFLDQLTHGSESKTPGFADEHLHPNAVVGEGLSVVDYEDVHTGGNAKSTAMGLWCRLFTGQARDDPRVAGGLDQLAKALPAVNAKGAIATPERVFFGSQAALLAGGRL